MFFAGETTELGQYAFDYCTSLQEIVLPDSLVAIQKGAFLDCTSLTNIILPEGLLSIEIAAFDGCTSLSSITLPDSLTTLGWGIFANCTELTEITIPVGFTSCSSNTTGPFWLSSIETVYYEATVVPDVTFNSCTTLSKIVFVNGVSEIGRMAFYGCTSLSEIDLPDGLTSIGSQAFQNCTALSSIVIPDTVLNIDSYAFKGCTSLVDIDLPNYLSTLSESVFEECTSLSTIELPDSLEVIDDSAFYGCTSLEEIDLPESLITIGSYVFCDCGVLSSIVLPDSVTSLGIYVFKNCTSLTTINLPANLTTSGYYGSFSGSSITTVYCKATIIPDYTFKDCTTLTTVVFTGETEEIGCEAFYGCTSLSDITLPDSLTILNMAAFYGCTSLTEINLPINLSSIGDLSGGYPFQNSGLETVICESTIIPASIFRLCTTLKTVIFTGNTTCIETYAFSGCTSLGNITLPDSITTLGYSVFSGCTSLTEINVPLSFSECTGLQVSSSSYSYGPFVGSSIERVTYEASTIPDFTFYGCTTLTDVTFVNDVTEVGDYAFAGCTALSELTLPSSITKLGAYIFKGSTSLTSINLPRDLTTVSYSISASSTNYCSFTGSSIETVICESNAIPDYTFYKFTTLKKVTFTGNTTEVGGYAFYGCTALSDITLPDSLVTIGTRAFYGCESLKEINLPINLTTVRYSSGYSAYGPFTGSALESVVCEGSIVPDYVLYKCTSLTSVTFTENVKEIGSHAFSTCSSLSDVTLPDSITTVGDYAFSGCSSLTEIELPSSLTTLGDYVFRYCTGITEITIPSSLTTSGESGAFRDSSITTATISDGMATIPEYLFWYCTTLTELNIPTSVAEVGEYATYSCSGLTDVYYAGTKAEWEDITINSHNNLTASDTLTIHYLNGYDYDTKYYTTTASLSVEEETISVGSTNVLAACWSKVFEEDDESVVISVESSDPSVIEITSDTETSYTHTAGTWEWKICSIYVNALSVGTADIILTTSDGYTTYVTIEVVDESVVDFESDAYIIEQVRKYTSSGLYSQYERIFNSDDSWDTQYQEFTELFTLWGFLDVSEGIEYLSSTTGERRAYLSLINNNMYTCYLYYDWLNNTVSGLGARATLIAAGLTFNNEINTWLDPLTWAGAKDTPGVSKYKDVLYDFMDSMSLEVELTETISLVKSIAKNSTDAGKLYAEVLINDLNKCTSVEELQTLISSNEAKEVFAEFNRNDEGLYEFSLSSSSGYGQFCKAMGYASTGLSLVTSLTGDICDLIMLDSNLALYSEYLDFLNEVMYATDLPWEMRLAASEILDELDQGAWGEILDIAIDFIDATGVTGIAKEGLLTSFLTAAEYSSFTALLTTINVTAFCVNKIVDVGALVKGTAYVEGYAYLSMHYAEKLEDCTEAFWIEESAENAWAFFENYNILYQLRYKGEEALLNMYKLDGAAGDIVSSWTDYAYKEEVINSVLESLEECRFNISGDVTIPESVQYSYKAVISCPVDVEVYAPDGTYITTLYDGVESDLTNDYGRFAVVYREYTGTYAKVVCLYQSGDYTFKATGTDEGLVNFEMASSVDGSSSEYTFTNEEISEGTVFIFTTETVVNDNTYDVDSDGDGNVDYQASITPATEDTYLAVESVSLDVDTIELDVDDSYLLSVTVTPSNATRKNVIWVSSDSSVAEITTGKIEAKSVGTATISCISQDNAELIATCEVNVIDSSELIAETKTTLSSTDWTLTQSDVESATGSTTADKISALVDAILAELDIDDSVTVTYTVTEITEAIAGDATDPDGTDGSFTINFTISAGNESDTLTETGTITATEYVHTHRLTHVEAKDATCTEDGNTEYWYCSGCDTYFSDEDCTTEIAPKDTIIEAPGHDYESVVTNPTCTESGYTTYTCSNCGDSYVADETEATGHSYEEAVTEPTCTEGGYATHTCSVCGDSYTDSETEALGHNYESEVTTEATCTEAGVMTYTCTRCDDTYTEEIEAAGHNYVATETSATCTEGGYTTYVCSECGDTYTDSETPALGHDYESEVTKEPTCTETGIMTYTCSRCGGSYTEDIDMIDHTYGEPEWTWTWSETEQTYTVTAKFTCEVCGGTDTETALVTSETTDATCTATGSTVYTAVVDMDGTTYSETKTVELPMIAHTEGEAVTENEVAATCTADGSYDTVIYCSVCGEELSRETVTVPATGHTEGEAVTENEVAATCTTDGSYDTVVYCTVCNEELSRETITVPATGHTEGEAVTDNEVAATCTTDGSYDTVVYCTVCNEELSRETITVPATGHTEGEAVTENEVAATCTTDGSYDTVVYCSVCGEELSRETVAVPATGHTTEIQNAVDATCTEDGYTGDEVCTVCGETITVGTVISATGHSFNSEGVCEACGAKTGEDGTTSTVTIGSDDTIFANVLPSGLVTSTTISISNDNGGTLVVSKIVEDSAYPYLVEHIADTLSFTLYNEAQGDDLISDTNSFTITTTENNKKTLKKVSILFYGDIDYSGTGSSTVTMNFTSASDLSSSDIYVLHYTGTYPTWEVVTSTVTFSDTTLTVEFEASDYSPFVVLSVASASSGGSSSALDILLRISANYSAVTEAIDRANALDPSDYVDFSAVTEAINAVNWNLKAINQLTVNAYADAINTAIDNLVETTANITEETVNIAEPIEDTNTDTEDDDDEPSETSEPESNPITGIAFSILPMMIAALATASSKRR